MDVVAAPDKFRQTATAAQIAAAIAAAVTGAGGRCVQVPMSDGGEGMLDAFGGANRELTVSGPLGEPVTAPWRAEADGTAIIESAYAAGIALVGGAAGNDAERASTRGVGELIVAAVEEGARTIVVGVGGSATTDGGAGAVAAVTAAGGLRGARLRVCCDVSTPFTDAARVFGPQKGANREQVERLTARLRAERERVLRATGLDLDTVAGSGAAGGLAGGLAALGAELVPGFDAVADAHQLDARIAAAHLVVTGEGRLDRTSLTGKVVGGVIRLGQASHVPVLVVAGQAEAGLVLGAGVHVVDLTARFGPAAARRDTTDCTAAAVAAFLAPGDG
jgi:glycerate 2-kinase